MGRFRRVGVLGIVTLGLALASCGSSGSDSSDEPTTTTTGAAASGTETAPSTGTPTSTTSTSGAPPTTSAGGAPVGSSVETAPEATDATAVVLQPDGVGLASFGDGRDAAIASLSAALGEPDDTTGPYQDGPETWRASATWDRLVLTFTGGQDALAFSSYEFGRWFPMTQGDAEPELEPWAPAPWAVSVATADGLSIGSTAAEVADRFAEVFVPDCTSRTLSPVSPTDPPNRDRQLFAAPEARGLYLRQDVDGSLWAIGALEAPNDLACDGAAPE